MVQHVVDLHAHDGKLVLRAHFHPVVRVGFADDVYGKEMGDMVEAETAANTVYVETLVRGDYDKDSYIEHMQENLDAIQMAFAAR